MFQYLGPATTTVALATAIAQKQQNGPNADTFLIGAAVIVVPLAAYALVRLIRIANKNKKK